MSNKLPLKTLAKARKNGIKIPVRAYLASRKAKIPFYVACAFLEQESAGGENVFGHDPSIFSGAGRVTKAKYLRYRAERKRTGKMQGVGPLQLTYWSFQDAADRLGGCWKPYNNCLVGFKLIASYWMLGTNGWITVGERYNGSRAYGLQINNRINKWKRLLG